MTPYIKVLGVNSLMVQRLGLRAQLQLQGAWVRSLVEELRSWRPRGMAKKINNVLGKCLLHDEAFWGEQGRLPKFLKMARESRERWWACVTLDTGPGWGDGTCSLCESTTTAKGRSAQLYYQPALPTWAEEEQFVVRLKGVYSQTSNMESDSFIQNWMFIQE